MIITINPKEMVPDDSWQFFRKVRAIIENEDGSVAISTEGGKCIFPGGKCDKDEDELIAIKRELYEELGIEFNDSNLHKVLELHTVYDDFFDFRSNSIKPRVTVTTYYCGKTLFDINEKNINLTDGEVAQGFKSLFVDRKTLLNMLMDDHSQYQNGKFFDEENRVIVEHVLKKKIGK